MNKDVLDNVKALIEKIKEGQKYIEANSDRRKKKFIREKEDLISQCRRGLLDIDRSVRLPESELDKKTLLEIKQIHDDFKHYINLYDVFNNNENVDYLVTLNDYMMLKENVNIVQLYQGLSPQFQQYLKIMAEKCNTHFFYNQRYFQYRCLNALVKVETWNEYDFEEEPLQINNFNFAKIPNAALLSFAIPFTKNYHETFVVVPENYHSCDKCKALCGMDCYHYDMKLSGKYDRRYHLNGEYDLIEKQSV